MHWFFQRCFGYDTDDIDRQRTPLMVTIKRVLVVFVIWTGVGLFFATPGLISAGSPKWPMVVAKLIDAWAWGLLTPAVMFCERHLGHLDGRPYRKTFILLLLSVPFAATHTLLTSLGEYPFEQISWTPLKDSNYTQFYALSALLTYSAIVGSLQAFRYYNQYLLSHLHIERMEKSLLHYHLNMLRLQIEPHFLFNTLNTISSVTVSDPGLARDMIGNLGTLLRRTLDYRNKEQISLSEELSLLECYLSIQQIRFGDRLHVHINMDSGLEYAMVPCFLLQPLVENSIRHGISKKMVGGTVSVKIARSDERIEISIVDDGVGMPPQWKPETAGGLGIMLTRERLNILYKNEPWDFDIKRRDEGGTAVTIALPLHIIGNNHHGTDAN